MIPCGPYGVVYSARSSSNQPYTFKEGYATLEQQWMSLLVAHPHISCAEREPEISYFVCNLRLLFDRNGIVLDHKELVDPVKNASKHPYTPI